MAKIQIKKSDLDRIIKEETTKFKKAITLKKELVSIQKQLKQLNEVEAGQEVESPGKPFVGKQHKPKFHNPAKNPHTMMEDGNEEEIQDTDLDVDNVDADMDDAGVEGVEDNGTIDKAAVLSAIEDLKMALNLHDEAEVEDLEGVESIDGEVEDTESIDGEIESEEGQEENGEETNSEEDEEGDETFEFEEEGGVQENLEEPIEGKSPIQNSDEDDVNDNMKKTNHPQAGGTLMESEKRRMAILAGIVKG